MTLPASASVGDTIKVVDYARKFATNKLTINQNSLKFQSYTSPNPEYNTDGQAVTLTYIDTTQGWIPTVDDDVTNEAYVSEQNLLSDDSEEPIKHPLINEIFSGKKGSSYFKPSN